MSAEADLGTKTSRFIKGELKKAGVTYDELVRRLSSMGIEETKPSIANKLGRGTFAATFLIAVMLAIGKDNIPLEELRQQT